MLFYFFYYPYLASPIVSFSFLFNFQKSLHFPKYKIPIKRSKPLCKERLWGRKIKKGKKWKISLVYKFIEELSKINKVWWKYSIKSLVTFHKFSLSHKNIFVNIFLEKYFKILVFFISSKQTMPLYNKKQLINYSL